MSRARLWWWRLRKPSRYFLHMITPNVRRPRKRRSR